jgi:hypothetical protein
MRTLIAILITAATLSWQPLAAHAAGDASAIRRATRTQDSRWVSNYRPGESNYRSGTRSSPYRRYSTSAGNNVTVKSPAVRQPTIVPQPTKAGTQAQSQNKSPVR